MARNRLHSPRLAVALAVTAAVALSACSGGSDSDSGSGGGGAEPDAVTDGAVNMDLAGPITSYDPAKGSGFQDAQVAWALYDSLITTDADGSQIAGLASDWSSTANSATFTLKQGVTCSDGSPLTPEVVAGSLTRLLDPATGYPFLSQTTGGDNPATVTTAGTDTVTVTLEKPWSALLPSLASPFTGIICAAGVADPTMLQTGADGTGAFVPDTQVAGSSYTFTRREDYNWGPEFADQGEGDLPTSLTMSVLTDDNTRANLMETSALQIGAYGSDAWTRFENSDSVTSQVSNQTDTFLIFNESEGKPTADPAVREAVAQALNRDGFNEVQSYGAGELITNLGQDSYQCADTSLGDLIPEYDAAAAAEVLDGESLTVLGANVAAGGDGNSYILSALEAAGVDGTLQNLDNSAYVDAFFSGANEWDVAVLGYGNLLNSLLAAGGFFTGAAPPDGQNLGAVDNADAAAALAAAGTATSEEAACAATSDFQAALISNFDVVPLSTVPVHVLFAGGTSGAVVKGFTQPSSIRIAG
jgi:peptide/nickel transport system substrate-binding protein